MKKAFTGFTQVPIERLEESSMNHFSKMEDENPEKWERFLCSIKNNGINVPLTVRPRNEGYSYEIISGHNRYRAAKKVGLKTVPAIIKDLDDVQAAFEMDEDNEQRENVSPLERGWSYRSIYEAIQRKGNQYTVAGGHADHEQNESAGGHADHEQNESAGGHADHEQNRKKTAEIVNTAVYNYREHIPFDYVAMCFYKYIKEILVNYYDVKDEKDLHDLIEKKPEIDTRLKKSKIKFLMQEDGDTLALLGNYIYRGGVDSRRLVLRNILFQYLVLNKEKDFLIQATESILSSMKKMQDIIHLENMIKLLLS